MRGGGSPNWYIGENVEFSVPVASRLREFDRDATHPQGLTMLGVAHQQRLFIDCAAAACTLARETTDQLPLYLTVLTYHEGSASAGQPEHQSQGAKVAIFDPEVIYLNVLEHLSNQAPLLGMTILVEKDISNQHALLVQHHECLARQGAAQVPRKALRRCSVVAK